MNKVRAAVIGVGIQGSLHAWVYSSLPSVELVAVCDLNEQRAREIASRYKAKEVYTDYNEMLEKCDIDIVSVAVPDHLHKDPALAVIKSGRHLLLEKPLATSLQDAIEIYNAAKKHKVKVMVNFSNRWSPPFIHAKKAIEEGELGEIKYMYTRLSDTIYVPTKMLSWASKTNVMWFLGSHIIDLTYWLMNRPKVKKVYGVMKYGILKMKNIDTPDLITGIIEWENDVITYVECLWILPETQPSIFDLKFDIIGTKGSIHIDTSHNRCIQKYTEKSATYPNVLGIYDSFGKPLGFVRESIEHFVECVLQDKEPMVTIDDALMVTKIIEGILKSCKEGKPVQIS